MPARHGKQQSSRSKWWMSSTNDACEAYLLPWISWIVRNEELMNRTGLEALGDSGNRKTTLHGTSSAIINHKTSKTIYRMGCWRWIEEADQERHGKKEIGLGCRNDAAWNRTKWRTLIAQCSRYTWGDSDVTSMPAGFRRHLVGKTLINFFHCDIAEIRFVGNLVIIPIFS